MLLWQGSIVEIDYGFFRVFGPYFIGKSLGTFKILIFGLWSFILHPYYKTIILQRLKRCHLCQFRGVHLQGSSPPLQAPPPFFFLQSCGASRWRVCYQRSPPRLFFLFRTNYKLFSFYVCLLQQSIVTGEKPLKELGATTLLFYGSSLFLLKLTTRALSCKEKMSLNGAILLPVR